MIRVLLVENEIHLIRERKVSLNKIELVLRGPHKMDNVICF